MSASEAGGTKDDQTEEVKGGELLFCGSTNWDTAGRKKTGQEGNLPAPTRLRPLVGVSIRQVVSGCASCHCVAMDVDGRCFTWGRNEKGQLGHGDTIQRDRPTIVSELSKHKIVGAAAGRSHTLVVTNEGLTLAFGWNKHGQLGSGSAKNEIESSPVRCPVSEVKSIACGADFTVWLTSTEGSSIMTCGLPQYGQLGHGTDNEYNTKDSSVRLAYEAQPRPKAIASFSGETIVKVACGNNHTVAVDKNGYVYTWGFGGYGRLGHREQKDEWAPRRIDIFTKQNVLPPNAVVSAGSVNSSCTAGGGQLYMWGKIKSTGDDWMYPKPLLDLSGWNIRCMNSGYMHHFVGADNSCISWGHAQSGELGYGPNAQKSSAVPKKVDLLEGMHVISTACGLAHSMVVVDPSNVKDRLDQLEVYDGKAAAVEEKEPKGKSPAPKKAPAKKTESSKKRKASKESSDSEEEEEEDDDDDIEAESDDSEEQANGRSSTKKKQRGGKAGRGNAAASKGKTAKGGGRAKKAENSPPAAKGNTGRRGRPKKQ
ncbi:protein RCC2 homolog [Impatiens glandulifera]|uniref:protein RCC2 homolog n=1 Tax=Impatiens glandulifera TaxID=253017 RepID=UPI001FB17749|nr:protein RCC2 homolog [Impatiens glandulifera]